VTLPPTHLCLGLPSGFFLSGFLSNILYAFLFFPIRAICPVRPILLDVTIQIILGEENKLWCSSLCSFLQPPVTSSLFGPNILLSTLFSNILSLCSSLNVRDRIFTCIQNYRQIYNSLYSKFYVFSVQYSLLFFLFLINLLLNQQLLLYCCMSGSGRFYRALEFHFLSNNYKSKDEKFELFLSVTNYRLHFRSTVHLVSMLLIWCSIWISTQFFSTALLVLSTSRIMEKLHILLLTQALNQQLHTLVHSVNLS
jgi:hypothetical protein